MENEHKYSILIVDDEKSNLDILNHMLKHSYNIYVAKSGKTALKRAIEIQPHLILLDVVMPDKDGFVVLTELKNNDVTQHIPVMLITGLSSVQDEEKGFLLGAVDYIKKPFNTSIVKARIKNHMQIVKQIETIERLGMVDALTDIPNRRSFDSKLEVEWRRALRDKKPVSLLMIDVDFFKVYNDTYGHPQGDTMLQEMAKSFLLSVNRATDFVARYGGEEFAVILPSTDSKGALEVAERIRQNAEVMQVLSLSGEITQCTISIGCATRIPSDANDYCCLIQQADDALYFAKANGRNQVCAK